MGTRLFRIQDGEGRGPYRPGTSHIWTDPDHSQRNPTFMAEFGEGVVRRARIGDHIGCAFQTMGQAETWFSTTEIARLRALGFRFVSLQPDRILAQSARQTIFVCRAPLWLCCREEPSWPHMRRAA